jgi:uncharacterized membrane protein
MLRAEARTRTEIDDMMIVLRVLHILSGVFWAGAVFFVAGFLMPSIRASGPAGGQVMYQMVAVRKYPIVAMIAAIVTILSGLAMYWRNISVSDGAFARSTSGMTYGIGAIAGIIAVTIGMTVLSPSTKRLSAIGDAVKAAGGPPSAEQASEMSRLQGRIGLAAKTVSVLLLIAVITMAIGRYV